MKKLLFIFSILCSFQAMAQYPTNGLVAFYPFNGDVKDYSGNGYHLTTAALQPTYVAESNGTANSALNVGNSNYFYNASTALMPTGSFTIAYWVKVASPQTVYPTVFEINESFYGRYMMGSTGSNLGKSIAQMGQYNDASNNFSTNTAAYNTSHTTWQHYALVFDAASGTAYGYLNGSQFSYATGINYTFAAAAATGLVVGGGTAGGSANVAKYLSGNIDDLMIYNRALSPSEITKVKNHCVTFLSQPQGGLFNAGAKVVLRAKVVNAESLQWKLNGVDIPNATKDSLVINSYSDANVGDYVLQATNLNGCGIIYSDVATIDKVGSSEPADGLVACYNFNQDIGKENIAGLNATGSNATAMSNRNTVAGKAVNFDGSATSNMSFPNRSRLKRQTLSIAMWVKPAISAGSYLLFAKNKNSADFEGLTILTTPDNKFGIVRKSSTSSSVVNISGGTYAANTWTHVVASVSNDSVKLYVNGVKVASSWVYFPTEYAVESSFVLGGSNNSAFYYPYTGAVDELKFYNKELTAAEVADLYSTGTDCADIVTAIEDQIEKTESKVYPNPANDVINFSGYAELYNLLGTKVAEGADVLDISELNEGVYLLKTKNKTQKVVKK